MAWHFEHKVGRGLKRILYNNAQTDRSNMGFTGPTCVLGKARLHSTGGKVLQSRSGAVHSSIFSGNRLMSVHIGLLRKQINIDAKGRNDGVRFMITLLGDP